MPIPENTSGIPIGTAHYIFIESGLCVERTADNIVVRAKALEAAPAPACQCTGRAETCKLIASMDERIAQGKAKRAAG